MLGRAIQLTLPYQSIGDSDISDTQSAKSYLDDIISHIRSLNINGEYLWGDLPLNLNEDLRIINLEAAPTLSVNNDDISQKSIHYHINIKNLPLIFANFVRPYVLCLANNHSLDMGRKAFIKDTLTLNNTVGIGINDISAYAPKLINNILIFAFGAECSGIPSDWKATNNIPGIAYLPPITNHINVINAFNIIKNSINKYTTFDKCIIISIHWGPNWAHNNDGQFFRRLLAHKLIDELNVDIIHGHSSHHIRGIELYKNKLILYGAGDLINDYENIPSKYNTNGALYIVDIDDNNYNLLHLEIIPFKMQNLRCIKITDSNEIKTLISFINNQSINDSETPLIINWND